MARHNGESFEKMGVIDAIQSEIEQDPSQPATSICERVRRKTGTKPSTSYVLTIRSRSDTYRHHIMNQAQQLQKEVERLDKLSLKLQISADSLADELKRASKSGDENLAKKLFNEEMSLWSMITKTNEVLTANCNRLNRLDGQIAGWGEEPIALAPLSSVQYDTEKWDRMFREARPAKRRSTK